MTLEMFTDGNSVIHRIDPRLRIVFAAVFSGVVAVSDYFPALFVALAASLALVLTARLNPGRVCKRFLVVAIFMGLLWLIVPLTYAGQPIYRLGLLHFSRPGVLLCAQISLKALVILAALMALVSTMTIATMGNALNHLRFPTKLVYLMLFTYRYVFVIEQEYQRLFRAMRIRGFRSATSAHSYQSYAYLIGMLFVRASARAERVSQAMKCRGFTGKFHSFWNPTPNRGNRIFAILMTIMIAFLTVFELWNKII